LADCKTFEQHKVYGLAINANTIQTEMSFELEWTPLDFTIRSIEKLFDTYDIKRLK
jgi:hydroxymethylpyrimidine/phosphomethylpyrimidine kinase